MRELWLKFWLKHKERLRPLFREKVPSRLCVEWGKYHGVVDMFIREIAFCVSLGLHRVGIYTLLDIKSKERILRAWKPSDLYLIEKLAVAFSLVEDRLRGGIVPDYIHVERLAELVFQWRSRCNHDVKLADVTAEVSSFAQEHTSEHAIPEDEAPQKIFVDHPLLDELYEIEESIDLHVPGIDSATSFDVIGLMLAKPLGDGRYDHCTPINCTPFACTDGDGTHYSLLEIDGQINVDSPVIMTMPSDCGSNHIVGETLHDFLCLGVEWGYFALEQIGYRESELTLYLEGQPNATPADLAELNSSMNPTKRKVLNLLKARFDLKPWTDLGHWQQLQDKYQHLLHLPPNL